MKAPAIFLFVLIFVIHGFSQEITEYDERILGTWEGTIQGSGLPSKTLKVVYTFSEFSWDEESGIVEGYSSVNNGSGTAFQGTYSVDGDMPFLELSEPNTSPSNGIFKLELNCITDEGSQDYCCGEWTSFSNTIHRTIRLEKKNDVIDLAIIQSEKLDQVYFKSIVSKVVYESPNDFAYITKGIQVVDKATGNVLQSIGVECDYRGKDQVSVGDYNFDGIPDFSVFEQGYAGANTTSLYFLYDPVKKQYYDSGFSGVSLEFDYDKKLITEVNQDGPERQKTSIYQVVNNQMELVEEHCYVWDESKEDYIEQDIKFCN
jgi:hypothetical protein